MSSLFQRNIIRSVKKSKNKIILKSSFFWKNDRHIWANIKINIWHKRLTNTIQKKKKKKSSIKYSQFNLSNECRVRSNCSIETGICLSRKISRCSFQPLEKWIRENTDGGARFFCFICEIIYIFFSRESWPKKIRDESEINRGQAFENPSSKDLIPFFFSAEFFLSSFIITHIYLWGQVNFRQISRRSFARWTKFRRMFQSHAMEKIGSFSIMV